MPASQTPKGKTKLIVDGLGTVDGLTFASVSQFCGIPYASLKKRWTRSELRTSWPDNHHDGTKLGSSAPNPPEYNGPEDLLVPVDLASHFQTPMEDELSCLVMNIVTPNDTVLDDRLPVMLYIHGGSFLFGGANKGVFDSVNFVSHAVERGTPVIAVNFNYRVGLGGFLASRAIKDDLARDGLEGVGNFGLCDQQVAIHWVNRYIASFCGDPDNVTIYGESAGGMSVAHQLAAKDPAPFRRAIAMSGQLNTIPVWPLEHHERRYKALLDYLGIDSASPTALEQLRQIPESVIAAATCPIEGNWNATGNPCADGVFHIEPPVFDQITSPPDWLESYMVGDTGDEGMIFGDALSDQGYKSIRDGLLRWISPEATDAILEMYGIELHMDSGNEELVRRMVAMAGDAIFKAHNWVAAHRSRVPKTFGYHFDQVCTWEGPFKGQSYHAIDLLYLFLNFDHRLTLDQQRMAKTMANHFIDFAYGKDPWPRIVARDPPQKAQWMRYGWDEVVKVVTEEEDEERRKYSRMQKIMDMGVYEAFVMAVDDIAGKRDLLGKTPRPC